MNSFNPFSVIDKIVKSNVEGGFLVCDLDDIDEKYKKWKASFPRVKPYYAVKCNPHPVVLERLANLGVGFDCSTKYEIENVLSLGVSPLDIIFANPIKDISHMSYAKNNGVRYTAVDSISELEKCKDHYDIAKCLIRIKTTSYQGEWSFDDKFGCDAHKEAHTILNAAKTLNLDVVGVAFHIGRSCNDPVVFQKTLEDAKYVFDVASRLGFEFNVLDIGGGFLPSATVTAGVYDSLNASLDKHFPGESVQVIAEPGTYFVSEAFTLATRVISVKTTVDDKRRLYYVDNGVFRLFHKVPVMHETVTPLLLRRTELGTEKYPSTIFGCGLAPCDVIVKDVPLPGLHLGDWLVFKNMGEYTLAVQTKFQGYGNTPIYFVTNAVVKCVVD